MPDVSSDPIHGVGAYSAGRWIAERLPMLNGLRPLFPGATNKQPTIEGWPTHSGFSIDSLIASQPVCVCWVPARSRPRRIAVDIDGPRVIARLEELGLDPINADTWRIVRTSVADRLKLVWSVTDEQAQVLEAGSKTTRIGKGPGDPGEELALFAKPGLQIVVLGNHHDKAGAHDDQYAWAGKPPSEIQPLPDDWFAVLQGFFCGDRPLRDEHQAERSPAAATASGFNGGDDTAYARAALSWLPIEDYRTYDDWVAVGMALHQVGDELLEDWIRWSLSEPEEGRRSTEGELREKWASFNRGKGFGADWLAAQAAPYGFVKRSEAERLRLQALADAEAMQRPSPGPGTDLLARQALADAQAAAGPQMASPPPAGMPVMPEDDLIVLRRLCDLVVCTDPNVSVKGAIHRVRVLCNDAAEFTTSPMPDLLKEEVLRAIARRDGASSDPYMPGEPIPYNRARWCVKDLLMHNSINVYASAAKTGKTTFLLALLASMVHGCGTFIGCEVLRPPTGAILIGPDQPNSIWLEELIRLGLATDRGDGTAVTDPFFLRTWTRERRWTATMERLVELGQICAAHPGTLVIIDSFAKVAQGLGIEEISAEHGELLSQLTQPILDNDCTPVVIHHYDKAGSREGLMGIDALRGHTSFGANIDHLVTFGRANPKDTEDTKRRVVIEGRGGARDWLIDYEGKTQWVFVSGWGEHSKRAKVAEQADRVGDDTVRGQALEVLEAATEPMPVKAIWEAMNPGMSYSSKSSSANQLRHQLLELRTLGMVEGHEDKGSRLSYELSYDGREAIRQARETG